MADLDKWNGTGLVRLNKALFCSLKGLSAAWVHESAFRQELVVLALLMPIPTFGDYLPIEKAMMGASLILLLVVELINSAIEAVVDRVGTQWHTLSGRAKDLGSASVFMTFLLVVWVWFNILMK
ncbi:diacylglycerol kinase [Chromohalobacter salexigens]|uniref:Diacylglycerol kinase n=1 Tax=Chromohalobacter canadensis TaxID=141389 RepID=A0ABZ0YC32_9GAMM|nr:MULTISPECIES: diacylglycerol kinase [Chromohalobacter]NWO11558.1 diacylglycerol kinase [Chromohalobacter salexigens]MCK0769460.1 diacylglycerol kinase [Chromohalobacter canadensis]MCK2042254.1 diacylglycerol kinase [Chromohalobacter moromii]MCT8468130.1 diacylglycerol kinase [Chromohalobacter canadensis]MCT8470160.1 diacylglycerol kinase [Chromohalobacter canadensis]